MTVRRAIFQFLLPHSVDRTRIARYHAYVGFAIKDNKPELLKQFEQMVVTDANGIRYRYETDLERLYEIKDAEEEPEFFEIYQS